MGDTRWLTDEEQRAWRAYLEATISLFENLDRQMQRDNGIPHAYYEILVRLSETPERAMRMGDLAAATRSSRSRLSHAAARLEERGWIQRVGIEGDRRGQLARLTDAGWQALVAAAPGHVNEVRDSFMDALTPEQVRQMETIFQAIIERMDRRKGGRPHGTVSDVLAR